MSWWQRRSSRKTQSKTYELRIAGELIPYTVTWKAVKNMNLRVMPDGTVKVSAPWRMPAQSVTQFVSEPESFIDKARQRFKDHRANQEKVVSYRYETGELFPILGYEARLEVAEIEANHAPYVSWSESEPAVLYMFVKPHSTVAERAALLEKFWEGLVEDVVKSMRDRIYHRYIEAGYDVPYPKLRIREAKTRWGSCSLRTERIMINQKLLIGPRLFLEYVMIHEFAHFIQPNHSSRFWQVVAEFMPQWQTVRRELTYYFRGR